MDFLQDDGRQTTRNIWDWFFKKENENQRKEDYDDILLFCHVHERRELVASYPFSLFSFLSPMTTLYASYARILAYLIWMLI